MNLQSSTHVDIVVPVHGGWTHVEKCLRSLESQTVPVNVIVVDDLSPDDTLARIRDRFGHFHIIANTTNRGFAASCNTGIRAGTSRVVVLVNSDVVANPDLAESLLAAFEADPVARIGSAAPILLAPDGSVDSFGISADVTGAGYVRYHGAAAGAVDTDAPRLLGPYGAVAAYARAALDDVGLLDENIFMYGEELDIALRLRGAGWGVRAVPSVLGTHIGGGSTGRESVRQRSLAGYGRGYLLRVYGVLRGRHAVRAIATEWAVLATRAVTRHDVATLRGHLRGWRAGARVTRRRIPLDAVEHRITMRRSFAMRRDGYWARVTARATSPTAQPQ